RLLIVNERVGMVMSSHRNRKMLHVVFVVRLVAEVRFVVNQTPRKIHVEVTVNAASV
ncbi:unnamed protein product, partial [marine sediment metagenome]